MGLKVGICSLMISYVVLRIENCFAVVFGPEPAPLFPLFSASEYFTRSLRTIAPAIV